MRAESRVVSAQGSEDGLSTAAPNAGSANSSEWSSRMRFNEPEERAMTTRILVVDDNPLNVRLVSDVLEAAGMSVSRAMDAIEAELTLKREMPNLVLMDVALPGMDGLSLTRKLRQEQRFARMPIVAMTASALEGDERKAIDAGCDGYIAKPIDIRTFATTVGKFLRPEDQKG